MCSNDFIDEIIAFVANDRINENWLFARFDQADQQVLCTVLAEELSVFLPQSMSIMLLHRLIALLDMNPTLLTMSIVS